MRNQPTGLRGKAWLLASPLLIAGALASSESRAQATLGELVLYPANVKTGVTTPVTVALPFDKTNYISNSAVLNEVDRNGRFIRQLAKFNDDGVAGDKTAGDGVFVARFSVSEPASTFKRVVASVAYRGTLTRSTSPPAVVIVADDVDPLAPLAVVDGGVLTFRSAAGAMVKETPLKQHQKSTIGDPSGDVEMSESDEAFVAEDQSHAGIITSRHLRSIEAREGDDAISTFRYFSSSGSELFQIDSAPGKTFFVSSSLRYLSRNGLRVLLVEVGEDETGPIVRLLNRTGGVVKTFNSIPAITAIHDAQLSSNGRYVGLVGSGLESGLFKYVVVAIDTETDALSHRSFLPTSAPSIGLAENLGGAFNIVFGNEIGENLP